MRLANLLIGILIFASISSRSLSAAQRYDFDGDAIDDISVYHRQTGRWYIRQSSDGSVRQHQLGGPDSTPTPGDYDGDRITDICVFHRPSASWYIRYSSTGSDTAIPYGGTDNTPVQQDYDGDGITDIAFFLRNTQQWYIRESSTGGTRVQQWGVPGSRPAPADYDGDGKADLAVYVPFTGEWHILESANNRHRQERFGSSVERPVPGYFDDDIYADLAIYAPKSGNWRVLESSTGQIVTRFWGALSAPAVPADYDGDGITDIAVYAPQGRKWYIRQSTDGDLRVENGGGLMARAIAAYAHGAIENLRIHCHGDSITFGTDSASNGPGTAYPIRLEEHLEGGFGGDIIALNFGNPGETTSSGRSRLARDLNLSRANVLLLMEGTNDHFFNTNFNTIESNLRDMVLEGLLRGMGVVIATIPPVIPSQRPQQHASITAFNPRIYDIARDYSIPVAQAYEYITRVPGWETSLMSPVHGNHPNDAGYDLVRAAFYDALAPLMNAGLVD